MLWFERNGKMFEIPLWWCMRAYQFGLQLCTTAMGIYKEFEVFCYYEIGTGWM